MISHLKKKHKYQPKLGGVNNRAAENTKPTQLKDILITTPLYSAKDVDDIISQLIVIARQSIIMPDLERPGEYYALSIRDGRPMIKKVDPPMENTSDDME